MALPLGVHSDDKTILVQAWLNGPAGGHPPLPVTTTSTAIQAARLAPPKRLRSGGAAGLWEWPRCSRGRRGWARQTTACDHSQPTLTTLKAQVSGRVAEGLAGQSGGRTRTGPTGDGKDFVSHAGAVGRAWAEWVAALV
jgi:hypothetical protein